MSDHDYILLMGFLTAFLVVLFTMPVLIKVARMKHLVDEPSEERKLHHRSIPTIGGIIIFAAIIFSYSLWFPSGRSAFSIHAADFRLLYAEMGRAYADFKVVIAAMVLLFFIGVKDDIIGFSPVKKLVGHMVVAYILVIIGDVRIHDMHGMLGLYELPHAVSIAFSFFTYIVLVNGFNGMGLHTLFAIIRVFGDGSAYGFPAEHRGDFLKFLEEFSAWMVNKA